MDRSGNWPQIDLEDLATAERNPLILRRPGRRAGLPLEIHLNYERVATASLPMALILSQRDSAASLLIAETTQQFATNCSPNFSNQKCSQRPASPTTTAAKAPTGRCVRERQNRNRYRIDGEIPGPQEPTTPTL